MRIGEVARRTGLTVHTLRFYDREGLLPAVARGASNYREFAPRVLEQVAFIRDAQALGFTIAELRTLLDRGHAPMGCDSLRAIGERKVADLDAEIQRLTEIRASLVALLRGCDPARAEPCEAAVEVLRVRRT